MKNIKICGFNIQLENILCVKIGNKKYNRKSYDKTKFKGESYNNFYNIIIRNVNRINYILVINHISDNSLAMLRAKTIGFIFQQFNHSRRNTSFLKFLRAFLQNFVHIFNRAKSLNQS